LSSERDEERRKEKRRDESLQQRSRNLDDREAEKTNEGHDEVLGIVGRPLMRP